MKQITAGYLLVLLLVASACQRALPAANSPTGEAFAPIPATETISAPEELSSPIPNTLPAATVETRRPANTPETSTLLPAPQLLDFAWADRTPFRSGLIDGSEQVLDQLAGVTTYHLLVDIHNPSLVAGAMEANYTNQENESLSELVLHLFPGMLGGDIDVQDVRVNGQAAAARIEENVLRVPLDSALRPGESVVLSLRYETAVPGEEGTKYNVLSNVGGTLALAHFYPMFAVYDEAGWHTEPTAPHGDETFADSSFYLAQISAPVAQTVVSSGVVIDQRTDDSEQQITVAAGPMRDFYLAANEDYAVVSQDVGHVTINSYAKRDRLDGAALALDTAVEAVQSFNTRFAAYPFSELDIVTTPTRALGIEYPGVFVNAEWLYDLSSSTGSARNATLLESTTAHETAHQWFYSLIGNDQLNEPWLDEALAQYATYFYYFDRYGRRQARDFLTNMERRWATAENIEMPIGLPAEAYSGQDYGAIVYGRGPIFVDKLAQAMGQDSFDRFMHSYFERYQYQIATAAEFRALAEETCGCDLNDLFEEWVGAP